MLHAAYFVVLQRGYSVGDLSVVYPLARGTGPMLAALVAIVFFGERPSPLALAGIALVGIGVFVLSDGLKMFQDRGGRAGVLYGLGTGVVIASYTLWDSHAVKVLLVPPLLFDWFANVGRFVLLTPFMTGRWKHAREVWRSNKLEVLGVAALAPLSYILALTAMVFTPVSYVAPAREVSIVIGAVLGARLLAEEGGRRRIAAAATVVLGVVALALG